MDGTVINAVVDVLIAIIGFGGGIGVALVTQKHTDERHEQDLDIRRDEDLDKHIKDATNKYSNDISELKNEFTEFKETFNGIKSSIEKYQAMTDLKIERLTDECRKHNEVIERTYRLEEKTTLHEEQIKVANEKIGKLERREEKNK